MTVRRTPRYIPERGDIVWVTFDSHSGHEQAGRRPALIVSPRVYNARSGLAIAAEITSHVKDYPFEVKLPFDSEVKGAILADQVRTFDWQARKVAKILSLPPGIVSEVLAKLGVLVAEGAY